MDLKSTLNLPSQDFTIPMKADLPKREPEVQQKWKHLNIYHFLQQARKDAPPFVLHDGPPYTNSLIHVGTAFNKILKDFVIKSRTMMGFWCPYIPGFDNHGLPIELAVMKDFQSRKEKPDTDTFRKACREHAKKFIELQTEQFKRLGVFGLWEAPYTTMGYSYEAEIVRAFKELVQEGYIYQGLRPVFWSPTAKTALADTEIVYKEHKSHSIYVQFPLMDDPHEFFEGYDKVSTVIWTTTPWTLPANVALAFHPDLIYAIVHHDGEYFILLENLAETVMTHLGIAEWEQVGKVFGASLENIRFENPLMNRPSIAVMADYVSIEEGTGVVHTAPGHGRDDFMIGMKYDLPVLCPVNESGVLTEEAGEFQGLFYQDANQVIIQHLKGTGHLLKDEEYSHRYPYAERDGKPVIIRTTQQWFLSMDSNDLRDLMLEQIEEVDWIPKESKARIKTMIEHRPDWCLSRQRPWGVGIPIFYGKESGKPVFDPEAIEAVAKLIEREGSDGWYTREPHEILPAGYQHPETEETEFIKEKDVFDVWFDSGCSSLCVIDGRANSDWKETWPADLYFEGSDQHRGWFNSSLIVATALKGQAPYKEVLTHGFVVDQEGLKMSKRTGNNVDPDEVCSKYGADILRCWAASVDFEDDVPCSEEILKQVGDSYRRIRNTLRFLLSNLYDYGGEIPGTLHELDSWIIEQTDLLVSDCYKSYEIHNFVGVFNAIHNFCVQQVSAFYADAIKDRMYCDGQDWSSRRSAQYACHYVLLQLVKLVAPIMPHTAEEVYGRIPCITRYETIFVELFDPPTNERLETIVGNELQTRFALMLDIRSFAFSAFEQWKLDSEVRDSQDVILKIIDQQEVIDVLSYFSENLPNYFKMSWVELEVGEPGFKFRKSHFEKCERSRLRRPDVKLVNGMMLTERDQKVLQNEVV